MGRGGYHFDCGHRQQPISLLAKTLVDSIGINYSPALSLHSLNDINVHHQSQVSARHPSSSVLRGLFLQFAAIGSVFLPQSKERNDR
jgi:hypothetical protein